MAPAEQGIEGSGGIARLLAVMEWGIWALSYTSPLCQRRALINNDILQTLGL